MIPLERILPDPNSSFRVLYHHVLSDVFSWDFHYHPEIELVYVFGGIGRRHVGNHVSYYESGDLVLIGSNLPHSGFGYGALDKHEEVVIQFKKELILESLEFQKIQDLFERAVLGVSFFGYTKEILEKHFKKIKEQDAIEKYISLLEILKILSESEEYILLNKTQYEQSNLSKDQHRLFRIFEFVEKNFEKDINTGNLAEISHLTIPAFCNYFKKNIGVSFTDFLNEYRINQACMMITEGNTISDVGFRCGFNSLSYFSRTFKTFKNMSPKDFQNKVFEKKERK
ncbi:AraC family transcriptional regulator [Lacihabitans sp. LS3-19]|uniref:AraC family transcriptional regulator n=1 Tax=Lacihabitans sp. LS3-19 TaxID=2487335 RepID=UPI0020CC5D2A|nr:AraC family transcriptional regulator [Lacihabitans sp. LS3-19]MCP9768256.1 AraC family transcriptional regulator [Lacihabitans sp. LS3-19]